MLQANDIKLIIQTLKAYYPYYYKDVTKEEAQTIIKVWIRQFGEMDLDLLIKAVDNWGSKSNTPPSIADIKGEFSKFYTDLDKEYSRLIESKASPQEIKRIGKQKELAWECLCKKRI